MKYFQKIPKDWKEQGKGPSCERCGQAIEQKKDFFTVDAHWKIKDKPDTYQFCSMKCLKKWAEEDTLVEA